MMKKKALIIGSGGHSRVVISIINEASLYDIVAIIDVSSKSSNDNSEFIKDIPVSNVSQLDEYYECGIDIAFIAIGVATSHAAPFEVVSAASVSEPETDIP